MCIAGRIAGDLGPLEAGGALLLALLFVRRRRRRCRAWLRLGALDRVRRGRRGRAGRAHDRLGLGRLEVEQDRQHAQAGVAGDLALRDCRHDRRGGGDLGPTENGRLGDLDFLGAVTPHGALFLLDRHRLRCERAQERITSRKRLLADGSPRFVERDDPALEESTLVLDAARLRVDELLDRFCIGDDLEVRIDLEADELLVEPAKQFLEPGLADVVPEGTELLLRVGIARRVEVANEDRRRTDAARRDLAGEPPVGHEVHILRRGGVGRELDPGRCQQRFARILWSAVELGHRLAELPHLRRAKRSVCRLEHAAGPHALEHQAAVVFGRGLVPLDVVPHRTD